MMKKKKDYPSVLESESAHTLQEPEVSYSPNRSLGDSDASYPVMSLEEALTNGMPLEESRRLMFERIHRDFQKP